MSIKNLLLSTLILSSLISCRPKPIEIEVPQKPGAIAISSIVFDDNAVFITAGYSIASNVSLDDTVKRSNGKAVPANMLIDSGLVTLTELGQLPDTLKKYESGIYGAYNLKLKPYAQYTLTVRDYKKGTAATATTQYIPRPSVEKIHPEVIRTEKDTSVKLHIKIDNIQPGEHYFIGYNTTRSLKASLTYSALNLNTLQNFEPRQLELLDGSKANNGILEYSFTAPIEIEESDTLIVQIARIDDSYFKYLTAYKKTGFLMNQLTGEPINLPSNVNPGHGYFSMYTPQRKIFILKNY